MILWTAHRVYQLLANELLLVCARAGVLDEGWVQLASEVIAVLVHAFPPQEPLPGKVVRWDIVFDVGICQMPPVVRVVGLGPILMLTGSPRLHRR